MDCNISNLKQLNLIVLKIDFIFYSFLLFVFVVIDSIITHVLLILELTKMRRCSPSSSEGALTSLRPDMPLGRQDGGTPSLDKFLDQIGHRYQIIIMFLLSANSIPIVVNHLLMAFYAVSTPHNCRVI